jgi:hypothetical protein
MATTTIQPVTRSMSPSSQQIYRLIHEPPTLFWIGANGCAATPAAALPPFKHRAQSGLEAENDTGVESRRPAARATGLCRARLASELFWFSPSIGRPHQRPKSSADLRAPCEEDSSAIGWLIFDPSGLPHTRLAAAGRTDGGPGHAFCDSPVEGGRNNVLLGAELPLNVASRGSAYAVPRRTSPALSMLTAALISASARCPHERQ